MKGVA